MDSHKALVVNNKVSAIINKLDNGDYIEQGMSDKLLEYDNAVILFMSSKEIYLLEEEYIKKLEERIKETSN